MNEFDELIEQKKKGSLKIYLGYAPGVGKTYQMLQEGHRLKARGLDVVIGYLEPHTRPETIAQIGDLEQVPKKSVIRAGKSFEEMDAGAILKRSPKVALIDELARTNLPESPNIKRYQDVLEILDHNINVISTLNVQHLESVADRIEQATHVPIHERLPDNILRRADQIVLVDVSMDELRERLRMGKIYALSRVESALLNFFKYENLSFLRETCLREVAGDQVRKIEQQGFLSKQARKLAEEAVMVCLSSDPTNAEILLRKANRLANQLSARLYAVYVQTRKEDPLKIDATLQRKLQNNLNLAKLLGAEVISLQAHNISEALVNFATEKQVKYAVFGKSRKSPMVDLIKGSVILNFLHDSVGIDVHIVTTTGEESDDSTSLS